MCLSCSAQERRPSTLQERTCGSWGGLEGCPEEDLPPQWEEPFLNLSVTLVSKHYFKVKEFGN